MRSGPEAVTSTKPDLIQPWRVASSRYVVEDRWMRMRSDDCIRADGAKIDGWYVMEDDDWAQIVAIDAHAQLVTVRQYRHGIGRVTRELPSGLVDAKDADPVAAGARELLEETGYASDTMRLVTAYWNNPAHCTNRIFVLLAENAKRVAEPEFDAHEEIAVELLPLADAERLACSGGFDHAAQVASLLVALRAR